MTVGVVLVDPGGEHDPGPVLDGLLPMADGFGTVFAPGSWADSRAVSQHRLFASRGVELKPVDELHLDRSDSPSGVSPAAALREALDGVGEGLSPADDDWLWILSPAHVPQPGALPALVRAARGSSRVAIVGPKLVRAGDQRMVVGVGHHINVWGRPADFARTDVFDQGQFDDTSDVIGVPITGMLIRRAAIEEIGGIQPALDLGLAGLDLSWRAHLRGYRVVAAPEAAVGHDLQASGALGGWDPSADAAQQRRVAGHRVSLALARSSWWRMPLRAIAMLLSSLAMVGLWTLARRPRAIALALTEAVAVGALGRLAGVRWGFRGRALVRERDLCGLFTRLRGAPARARFAGLDGPAEPVGPEARSGDAERSVHAMESGPVSEEAASLADGQPSNVRRWWSWPAAVALVLAMVAAGAGWRNLGSALSATSWGVHGPELSTTSANARSMWANWASGWSGTGLGEAGQGPVWYLPLAAWTWLLEHLPGGPDLTHSGAVATTWLLVAAIPLSTLSAYRACRRVLPARWARAVLALGWAGLAPFAAALDEARLGPVVVHILAPLVVAGVLSSLQPGRRGTSAAFGTAVLIAVGAAFVPILLIAGIVGGAILLLAAPGWSRLRGLPLALLPLVLLGPEVWAMVAHPALALGGAGATVSGGPQIDGVAALMLHPGGPVSLALWWVLPAWLLVALAVLDPGRTGDGKRATGLALIGLLGIAGAMVQSRLVLGEVPAAYSDAGAAITPWPGTLLSLAGAALLLAVALGVGSACTARSIAAANVSGPRPTAAALSVLVLIGAAAAVATTALHGVQGIGPGLSSAGPPLPAVVAERTAGPERVRLIRLAPRPDPDPSQGYVIGYDIGSAEPQPWLRDRSADMERGDPDTQPAPSLNTALLALGDDTDSAVIDPAPLEEALASLAVGYVSVHADPDHPVVEQLDRLPSLIRVNSGQGEELWRVRPEAAGSRAWWQDGAGTRLEPVPVQGVHSATDAPVPSGARFLAVAQPSAWAQAARVSADGQLLTAVDDGAYPQSAYPQYALPQGSDRVKVDLPVEHPRWWWASAIAASLALFLSAPLLRPRRRP